MTGRRPTPTHLRLLRGNPGHRPLPAGEPEPPASAPLMPPWLRAADAEDEGLVALSLRDLRERAAAAKIQRRSRMDGPALIDALLDISPGPRERAWQEIAPALVSMRVLTAVDVHALALAVIEYVRVIHAELFLANQGVSYETEGRYGLQVKRRPEVGILSESWEKTLRGLIEFGMTPASRTKVAVAPVGRPSAMEELLSGSGS